MAMTLSQIRAKLQEQENNKKGGNNSNSGNFGPSEVYCHWNIEDGESTRLRLLPDGNSSNSYFWAEKAMIKLPFAGILGQSDSKPIIVQVPCIEMWPENKNKCPILAEVRPWFKAQDPVLEEMGRKYWMKRSYIFQGFVRENPLKEEAPENPIRRFTISPQIFALVKGALMDPELENMPIDYDNGLDFIVSKTMKGQYADYATSKWARKESALTADERAAIEQYGLFDLGSFLPKRPTQEELDIMVDMFHASVDGQAYDPDKWGKYFKPAGFQTAADSAEAGGGTTTASSVKAPAAATKPKASPVVSADDGDDDTPAVVAVTKQSAAPAAATSGGSRAEDILASIRNRQKAQ